jgi:polysaccharide export outer membrane protein
VFKVPELSRSVQVADTGTINLPLVGEVPAAGMTAQEVERSLARKLGAKFLQNPQVTVYVREYQSQRVTVEGAVRSQGVFPLKGRTTLMQIIAMAGGLDTKSDSTVVVVRIRDETRTGARFDLDDIKSGKAADPVLEAGDMVMVGTSKIKESLDNVLKVLPLAGLFAVLAH